MALTSPDPKRPTLGMTELIAMTSALMALNALSIDIMLPALPDIGQAFGALGNERQLIITAYVFGFGIAQIAYGPLADALGRRTVLLVSLGAYSLATLLCLAAPDFGWMLAARALQGAAAAGTRVIATAVVRDLVSGRRMAQIISIAMTFFHGRADSGTRAGASHPHLRQLGMDICRPAGGRRRSVGLDAGTPARNACR